MIPDWLQPFAELDPELRDRLLNTILLVVVLLFLRWVSLRILRRGVTDPQGRYRWRKNISYATAILAILLVGRLWSSGLRQLGTFLGLVTAALAIALREPVTNLAGWLFILWRRPFRVGDRVQVSGVAGDVVDLRLFQFTVFEIGNWVGGDQPTGRIVHVPNAKVFSDTLANYSRPFPFIWNEVAVLITFESNWRKAKGLLSEIAVRQSVSPDRTHFHETGTYSIARLTEEPQVITSVEDSGVLLTIRYACDPRRRRMTAQAVWEDVLSAFEAAGDIDLAYPTKRIVGVKVEG